MVTVEWISGIESGYLLVISDNKTLFAPGKDSVIYWGTRFRIYCSAVFSCFLRKMYLYSSIARTTEGEKTACFPGGVAPYLPSVVCLQVLV